MEKNGLSPLARGTLIPGSNLLNMARFIPAGAGNSRIATSGTVYEPVYPRWRGELPEPGNMLADLRGLSPLARGTRLIL